MNDFLEIKQILAQKDKSRELETRGLMAGMQEWLGEPWSRWVQQREAHLPTGRVPAEQMPAGQMRGASQQLRIAAGQAEGKETHGLKQEVNPVWTHQYFKYGFPRDRTPQIHAGTRL